MSDGKRYWSITEGAFNCLIDEKRTKTFRQAIMDSISQGDVVVDAGSGTGILALFAAEAGAKLVYAIESDPHYFPGLRESIRLNGFGDRIKLMKADVTTAVLPESVDVIICEMTATGLIEELQVPAMNNLLKYGKKKVKVVLSAFENYVDLVQNNDLFYNHRLKIIRYEYPGEETLKSRPLTETVKYAQVNFSTPIRSSAINCHMILTINRGGVVNGMRISSKSIFYNGTVFDASFAYSYPIILPLDDILVSAGQRFSVEISYIMCAGLKHLRYAVSRCE